MFTARQKEKIFSKIMLVANCTVMFLVVIFTSVSFLNFSKYFFAFLAAFVSKNNLSLKIFINAFTFLNGVLGKVIKKEFILDVLSHTVDRWTFF